MTPTNGRRPRRRSARLPRWFRAALAVLCVVVLTGCQTTAWVRVDVQPDGSGSVVVDVYLDQEAADQVGDLSKILVVDDLKKAGWTVTGPAPPAAVSRRLGEDQRAQRGARHLGAVQVHLAHPFADVEEANQILASLSGPDGPFHGVELTRHSSLFKTEFSFRGTVDLRRGLDTFGDADLTKVLGGSLADTVAASNGTKPDSDDLVVGFQLVPSDDLDWSGAMGNQSMGNQTVSASTHLGAGPEHIDVHAEKTRSGAVITAAVLIGLLLLGLVVLGFVYRRRANRAQRSLLPEITVPDIDPGPHEATPGDSDTQPDL